MTHSHPQASMPVAHKQPWAPGMAPGDNHDNGYKDTAQAEAWTPNKGNGNGYGKSTPANTAGVAPKTLAGKLPVAPDQRAFLKPSLRMAWL